MRIAVLAETDTSEPRVAATPETVKKFVGLGAEVAVQAGAGAAAGVSDADYAAAGAAIARDAAAALAGADIALRVRRPTASELPGAKQNLAVIAIMDPFGAGKALAELAKSGTVAFAMELMPRITRAQSMDVLSSQANLAGYRAVIDATAEYGRSFPMMMTAAGTVPAAKVFIMGVGVAGLQAIATARRIGAIVTATDVRPATKEQVESLGAKFLAVENEEFQQAQTAGGYAKEMSPEYQKAQAALVASHIAKQDVVITTALIPGRPAPKLDLGRDGAFDAAGLGHRRSRGRARRQLRIDEARRNDRRRRRQDRRRAQSRRPHGVDGFEPLRQESAGLRRDADLQGDEAACDQLGRRIGEGDRADARRRRHRFAFSITHPALTGRINREGR